MAILKLYELATRKVEDPIQEQLDIINSTDVSLLITLILFQLIKENRSTVYFDTFCQYPFEKIEIDDYHDYHNLSVYIYERCISDFLPTSLSESPITFLDNTKFTVDTEFIVSKIIEKAHKTLLEERMFTENISSHYADMIEKYFELQKECNFKRASEIINHRFNYKFEVGNEHYRSYIVDLLDVVPECIEINFIFKKDLALDAESKVNNYLIANPPSEDLIEFQDYILNLKFANGRIKIPFESMGNDRFRVVEMLRYLELTHQIEIQDWIGKNSHWEIRLLSNEMLSLFIPNIDLLIQKKESTPKTSMVCFTEDGNLEYEMKEPIFDLTPLQKVLCKKLYSEKENYNFETIDIELAVYGGDNTKQSQEKLKKLIERLNGKVRDAFGIKEWIHYGANNLRRLV